MKVVRSLAIDIGLSISTLLLATLFQVLSYRSISSRFDDSILVNWMVVLTLFSLMPLVYAGAQQRLVNRFISGRPEEDL